MSYACSVLVQRGTLPFLRVQVPPTEEFKTCCSDIQRQEGRPTSRKPGCKSSLGLEDLVRSVKGERAAARQSG